MDYFLGMLNATTAATTPQPVVTVPAATVTTPGGVAPVPTTATGKPKRVKPKPPVEIRPKTTSEYALPKWTPYVLGIIGLGAVITILFTSKGKN